MAESGRVENLIRELDAQRDAYMEAFQKAHEILTQNLAASSPRTVSPRMESRSQYLSLSIPPSDLDSDGRLSTTVGEPSVQPSSNSKTTGEESDSDEDETLYAQTPLATQFFHEDGLRAHIQTYKWDKYGKQIVAPVLHDNPLLQGRLLPSGKGPFPDRSHYTHSQIFDVGPDGSPLLVDKSQIEGESGRGMALWHAIKEINPPSKERRAVGRITIVREPSPILFAAVHYAMNCTFDVDELFRHLVEADLSSARMFRTFDENERKRRSFVWNFEYFTLIGKDCQPMDWQLAAGQEDRKPGYIQITRCSSTVALVLNGPPIKEIKNSSRRRKGRKERGSLYDPFAAWQVLNLQCYPDWKANLNVHDSTKHYVNGPEAFMTTVLGEYRDAARRFDDITKTISRRVRPSFEFMFDSHVREELLFEDDEYNIVKRYFWAHQTLEIMNESMEAMIDAYEDNFTDDVWEGKNRTLWPLLDENSARNKYYRKKMAALKDAFETEMVNLRKLVKENEGRQKEIIALREALFAGTSIKESRTTIQQGQNIKILTLVSIFFLPLTFVTSVFGMTNMPTKEHYWMFGIVVTTVCVPFFVLIGSLNTQWGMHFWRNRTKALFRSIGAFFKWALRGGKKDPNELTPVKSFDSASTMSSSRRWSNAQRAARTGQDMEDPVSREDQQRRLDDLPTLSKTRSMGLSRPESAIATSTIAAMWSDEAKRSRIRYSEHV